METEGPFPYVPHHGTREVLDALSVMERAQALSRMVTEEFFACQARELDRELMCMAADSTGPRKWGNPEAFHEC